MSVYYQTQQQYHVLEVASQSLRVDFNSYPCKLSSKGLNRVTGHNHHLSGADFTCQVPQQSQNSIFTPTMQRNSMFLRRSEACFTSSDNVVFKSRNKILRHEGDPDATMHHRCTSIVKLFLWCDSSPNLKLNILGTSNSEPPLGYSHISHNQMNRHTHTHTHTRACWR